MKLIKAMSSHTFSPDPAVKIAFLEDDPVFAADICRELEARHYTVTHFATGQACLSHLVNHDHDLCLFDWHLPDSSGRELFALADARNIPAVAYTAYEILPDIGATVISKQEPDKLMKWLEDVERKKDE